MRNREMYRQFCRTHERQVVVSRGVDKFRGKIKEKVVGGIYNT